MKRWNTEGIEKFIDNTGTKYTKGPFEIDGHTYDYKLEDKDGEDYCTINQMVVWDVEMVEEIFN